jgi:hypothetical protein
MRAAQSTHLEIQKSIEEVRIGVVRVKVDTNVSANRPLFSYLLRGWSWSLAMSKQSRLRRYLKAPTLRTNEPFLRYLEKWLFVSIIVGFITGLVVAVFDYVTSLTLWSYFPNFFAQHIFMIFPIIRLRDWRDVDVVAWTRSTVRETWAKARIYLPGNRYIRPNRWIRRG